MTYRISGKRRGLALFQTGLLSLVLLAAMSIRAETLMVSDAWFRLMPPGSERSAAYLAIENTSGQDVTLRGVRSTELARVEIHSHDMTDGVMRMRKLEQLEIPAGERLAFRPGGYHLMLFGMPPSLQEGSELSFELIIDDGRTLPFVASARKP